MIARCFAASLVAAATLSAGFAISVAQAQDASEWVRDSHSAVRLLAGSRSGAVLLGGVAFQLAPGWKTYWRTPGDSGVPAHFDFTGSDNVDAVTVLWPAPTRFPDGAGGHSFGYAHDVVLPLRIIARQADKPVTLRARILYAVCERLCVPVEATVELPFVSVASTEDGALAAALDAVPKPANVGDATPLTIVDVRREGARVLVDVGATGAIKASDKPDDKTDDVELFVEGPSSDWALPSPVRVDGAPAGLMRFAFDLDGVPPGADPSGAALRLTLVGAGKAYEFNVNLD
ncbi:MAG: cytochrome C biogenesis protein [Proteobacteria bacterium]|nr:MAG: cytochrome C biogenesis protein [Pseudomonadota bacterium]